MLALVGPACMGDIDQDSKTVECAAAEAGARDMRGTDTDDLDPDNEVDMSPSMSEQAAPHGGATGSYKTCSNMYFDCTEKGGACTKGFPGCNKWGESSCNSCYKACQANVPYPKACRCNSCGFTE